MFGNEVDYRLAKWLLINMAKDGVISEEVMRSAWAKIASHYKPPFLGLEDMEDNIGDGVIVDAK